MHLVEGQQRQRDADKQTVPVSNPIVLQGGIDRNEETEAETFAGAINGETLTKAPQKVPGALAGLFESSKSRTSSSGWPAKSCSKTVSPV